MHFRLLASNLREEINKCYGVVMGRSALVAPESQEKQIDLATLDDRIASILVAIEEEKVPERLLGLASELQQALLIHRQRRHPN